MTEQAETVTVSLSVTRNLGNFNSIKPQADYSTFVRKDETVDEAFARAWKVVEDQIELKITEAIEALG